MEFEPRSEREIKDSMVLPPGDYDFEVVTAKETISKKNNDMIEMQVRIFPDDGSSPRLLRDWLLPSMELKLNRFCHAVGLEDLYFAGALTAMDCEGRAGRCKLTVKSDEQYGNQNSVKDYLAPSDGLGSEDTAANPQGVPTEQGKRSRKVSAGANDTFQEAGYETETEIPF